MKRVILNKSNPLDSKEALIKDTVPVGLLEGG